MSRLLLVCIFPPCFPSLHALYTADVEADADGCCAFVGKSITTEQWKAHLYGFYEKHDKSKIEKLNSIDWDVRLFFSPPPPLHVLYLPRRC